MDSKREKSMGVILTVPFVSLVGAALACQIMILHRFYNAKVTDLMFGRYNLNVIKITETNQKGRKNDEKK